MTTRIKGSTGNPTVDIKNKKFEPKTNLNPTPPFSTKATAQGPNFQYSIPESVYQTISSSKLNFQIP